MEKSHTEIDLVASLLVAAKKAGEVQELEEIGGVELTTVGKEELKKDSALTEKLREMYAAANAHKSKEDLARLLGDFEKHLAYDPKFHLLYFDQENVSASQKTLGSLVGFVRSSTFDGRAALSEGERYLGAMNIDPLLQKFYVGENFLQEVTAEEINSGAKKLIAHVPKDKPSHKIVQNLGFRDISQEGNYTNNAGEVIAKRISVELEKK